MIDLLVRYNMYALFDNGVQIFGFIVTDEFTNASVAVMSCSFPFLLSDKLFMCLRALIGSLGFGLWKYSININ